MERGASMEMPYIEVVDEVTPSACIVEGMDKAG